MQPGEEARLGAPAENIWYSPGSRYDIHRRYGAELAAPPGRSRARRRGTLGPAGLRSSGGAVRLSVPLRTGAVVPAEGWFVARQLLQVLLRSVPLPDDREDLVDRLAGDI